jgi:hypothetical protein
MSEELNQAVKQLAQTRYTLHNEKLAFELIEDAIAATQLGKNRDEKGLEIKSLMEEEVRVYTAVCLLAQEAFEKYGNKHPHDAVVVKEYETLHYDLQVAREWVLAKMPELLDLNQKKFEKVAAAAELSFVAKHPYAKATVAKDLDKWLEG